MSKIIAVDIETTGLDPWKDKITCVGFDAGDYNGVLREDYSFLGGIRKKNYEVVGHNFKFDEKFLILQASPMGDAWQHDTQIMAHIATKKVDEEYLIWYEQRRQEENKKLPHGVTHRQAGRLSLKVLAPFFLGVEPFWENPANHDNDEYVLKDCNYTLRLFEYFKKVLEEEGNWEFYRRAFEWNKMLLQMEMTGISLDEKMIEQVQAEYEQKKQQYYAELTKIWTPHIEAFHQAQISQLSQKYNAMKQAALDKTKDLTAEKSLKIHARYQKLFQDARSRIEPLNYASSAQMGWLLKNQLGYNIQDNDGKESTKKSVLNRLAKEGKEDISTYLKWREAEKVLTMYLPTYKELSRDGVIHPTFNMTGTRTGRLSSSEPNMQQVPSKLYKLFKPRDGHTFLQHDLAGIEAALIALYSDDEQLFKILEAGESIHNYNAITFFDLKCEPHEVPDKYPKERRTAKTIGFALFYGAGFRRIKESFLQNGYVISDQEAKRKLAAFREFYYGATEFHKEVTEIFEQGGIVHNLFGRPITIQAWENPFMNGFNTLIQSSASDLNIRAAQKAADKWRTSGLTAYPLLLVHDFILAEASKEHAEAADRILVDAMTGFKLTNSWGQIKLKVDGGIADEWKK